MGYATETRAQLEMRRSNDDYRELFFSFIYRVNTLLGNIFSGMMRYEQALYHWHEALAAARLYKYDDKSEKKPESLISALVCRAQAYGSDVGGAKYAEEAYNIVSALNRPEHPKVQSVATTLIDCYIAMGNFFRMPDGLLVSTTNVYPIPIVTLTARVWDSPLRKSSWQ